PPILDKTAVTRENFFGKPPVKRNPDWYPTGDLFSEDKPADIVSPYNLYGGYCLNCHASAEKGSTFASLDNIITSGILYKHFPQPAAPKVSRRADVDSVLSGAAHADISAEAVKNNAPSDYGFSEPLGNIAPGFKHIFGDLGAQT